MKYLFGPINSRRLGSSLGIDLIPFKTCTQNCIYCECGRTTNLTGERKEYVPVSEIISELIAWSKQKQKVDFITLAGSGEPTLNTGFGKVIEAAKLYTDGKVCVLTNGTLLHDTEVLNDIMKADLIVPSFDAADAETYNIINRAAAACNFEKHLAGMERLFSEYRGTIWLEIFIVPGINDTQQSLNALKTYIERFKPQKVQLNTAVRPTAETEVKTASVEQMKSYAEFLGDRVELAYTAPTQTPQNKISLETLVSIIERRPSSLQELAMNFGMSETLLQEYIEKEAAEKIKEIKLNGQKFYAIKK